MTDGSDSLMMREAIDQSKRSSAQPHVGCAIAKGGRLISVGYKHEDGMKHAERVAIEKLQPNKQSLKGATLYTTLEPCLNLSSDQQIKSCAELIVDSEITKVVIGVLDQDNEAVHGFGAQYLRDAGVKVRFFPQHLREEIATELRVFKDGGDRHEARGSTGKRIQVVHQSGTKLRIVDDREEPRWTAAFRWESLQIIHRCVDLIGANDSIRRAQGCRKFQDICDPTIFVAPSHAARLWSGDIAVIDTTSDGWKLLIQLVDISPGRIVFRWQVKPVP